MVERTKEESRALFMQQAERAGVGQMSPGERAIVAVAPSRESVPSRVDLASGKPEHTITLRRASDGSLIEVHPLIRTGYVARESAWYVRRLSELEPLMEAATDKTEFDRLNQQYSELQDARSQLIVPDLPDGLLDDLSPGAAQRFWETIDAIVSEEMDGNDPNRAAQGSQ